MTAAAEVMLTDYLKGRVCFNCNLPSTKMSKCGSCSQVGSQGVKGGLIAHRRAGAWQGGVRE